MKRFVIVYGDEYLYLLFVECWCVKKCAVPQEKIALGFRRTQPTTTLSDDVGGTHDDPDTT
jgi:hypothetical protein